MASLKPRRACGIAIRTFLRRAAHDQTPLRRLALQNAKLNVRIDLIGFDKTLITGFFR